MKYIEIHHAKIVLLKLVDLIWSEEKTFQKTFFYVFQVLLVAFHCP